MVRQLVIAVGPPIESPLVFSQKLDGTVESLEEALRLVQDLAKLCPPYVVCVIDGIDELDYGKGQEGCRMLLEALRELMDVEANDDGDERMFKVLFTTASQPGTLLQNLAVSEMLLEDEGVSSLELMELGPGRTPFAELSDDIG